MISNVTAIIEEQMQENGLRRHLDCHSYFARVIYKMESCVKHCVHNIYKYIYLSYDVATESAIKPCIKNDNPLVD